VPQKIHASSVACLRCGPRFGANDAKLKAAVADFPELFVSVPEFTANLRKLAKDVLRAGVQNVILVTPPPLVSSWMKQGWMMLGLNAYEVSAAILMAPSQTHAQDGVGARPQRVAWLCLPRLRLPSMRCFNAWMAGCQHEV
jgi:hypothetical protein